jgi:hypothetical protein
MAQVYLSNGKHFEGKPGRTIGDISKELNENNVYLHTYTFKIDDTVKFALVAFRLFTDIPLWLLGINDSSQIQSAIKTFDLEEFLTSWKFESELEKYIKKGTLTDIFILETLGPPNNKSKYFDVNIQIELWTYSRLGVILTLKNGIVTSYIKID